MVRTWWWYGASFRARPQGTVGVGQVSGEVCIIGREGYRGGKLGSLGMGDVTPVDLRVRGRQDL